MSTMFKQSKTAYLVALGFDESYQRNPGESITIGCSACQAVCVNGIPTHERGCVNIKHECAGCNAIVGRNVKYCEDCR